MTEAVVGVVGVPLTQAESCGCKISQEAVACSKRKDEGGWDDDECAGEKMVEQVAGGVNVLDADEMQIETLADKGEEHRDEDQKQGLLWDEVEMLFGECSSVTHTRRTSRSCCNGTRCEVALPRIGGRNNNTDGFLVEAFEAAMALKVFEVAADSAFFHELLELLLSYEFGGQEALGAFAVDRPALAFGEGLAQKFEIGKRFHGVDAAALELIAQEIEIETGFKMVHPGFKKTFAMEADPEANGAEPRRGRELLGGKINLGFFGHEVHIRKDDNADDGLLGNLGAPTGFGAGVVTLAFLEAEFQEEFVEVHEMFAGTAKGVVIVVAPAEAELVLAALLDLGGAIARFPIGSLGIEVKLAGEIAADELKALVENLVGDAEAVSVIWKKTATSVPEFFGFDDGGKLIGFVRSGDETTVGVALDRFEAGSVFFRDNCAAIAGEGFAFDFGGKIVSGNEIGDEFRAQRDDGGILFISGTKHHARQGGARVFIDDFAVGGFDRFVGDETGLEEVVLFGRGNDEVVDPFEEVGAGLFPHAVSEIVGE